MSAIADERLDLERRHDRLVDAAHETIRVLLAPFAAGDPRPGNIDDAVDELRRGLGIEVAA